MPDDDGTMDEGNAEANGSNSGNVPDDVGRRRRSSSRSLPPESPAETGERLSTELLEAVARTREDRGLHDVSFLVGRSPEEKREVGANSTVLSLRSEYFRAMCFGAMRSDRQKVISDMRPETFERVLDFLHNINSTWMSVKSPEDLLELRYAAAQFLISDLESWCLRRVSVELSFHNGVEFLRLASAHRDDGMRRQALRTIKNRHTFILGEQQQDEVAKLEESDLVELMNLYKHVQGDLVLGAVLNWGKRREEGAFRNQFRNRLFRHIEWGLVSNELMLEVRQAGLLTPEMESEAMAQVLGRTSPLPEEEGRTFLELVLDFNEKPAVRYAPGPPPRIFPSASYGFNRLVLRTEFNFKGGVRCDEFDGPAMHCLTFGSQGMSLLSKVDKRRKAETGFGKPLRLFHLDEAFGDVTLEFAVNGGAPVAAGSLRAEALHAKVDNRDVFFFLLEFEEVKGEEEDDGSASLSIRASFSPYLLKDLVDFVIPDPHDRHCSNMDIIQTSHSKFSNPYDFEAELRSWTSYQAAPSSSGSEDGSPPPVAIIGSSDPGHKYFFQGCGLLLPVALM